MKAKLELSNGYTFEGILEFDTPNLGESEIIFNTSMADMTRLITDPASKGQALLLTYPIIGNVGVSIDDFQSDKPQISALIISRLSEVYSNFRANMSLKEFLAKHNIPLITGVDTRAVVHQLRGKGEVGVSITADGKPNGSKFVPISCQTERRSMKAENHTKTLAVLDTGIRRDLEQAFLQNGISLELFPFADGASGDFDGYILPDGPGDPARYDDSGIKEILKTNKPIFATGLGHQLLARANDLKTGRLPTAHRGANIPARNTKTGKTFITTQNHSYTVLANGKDLPVSYVNVNDGTIEGLAWRDNIISLQFNPEIEHVMEFIGVV